MEHKHTIAVLVENHFGVLGKVAGLFSARGFNIDSLTVGETQDPTVSRMTIVAKGDDSIIEQIIKQLNRLIDVIEVKDLSTEEIIDRELVLVKVTADKNSRPDIMQIVTTFRAKVVDVNQDTITIEVTGGEGKIDAMLELFVPFGILEIVRTGLIAMSRDSEFVIPGSKVSSKPSKKKKATKKKVAKKKTAKKKRSRK